MTNAELAKWFASQPPNERATLHLLNADSGLMTSEPIVAATSRMLEQIEDEFFVGLPDEEDDDNPDETNRLAADKERKTWLGTPVIFQKH